MTNVRERVHVCFAIIKHRLIFIFNLSVKFTRRSLAVNNSTRSYEYNENQHASIRVVIAIGRRIESLEANVIFARPITTLEGREISTSGLESNITPYDLQRVCP